MNQNLQILCIIVTYNGGNFIKKCLQHLQECIPRNNIIVIDNCSTDNTIRIIEDFYSGVRLIKLDRNYGFGRANNCGLRLALDQEADYVFLLNQDVYVESNTLSILIELAEQNPGYAILSPMQLNGKGDCIDFNFSNYLPFQLISDSYLKKMKTVYPCSFINAASWLVSKKCIKVVGGFDPVFFHYGEDNDYVNRVRYYKMSVGICLQTRVNHDRGFFNDLSTYPDFQKEYLEYLIGLKNINYSFLYVLRVSFLNILCDMVSDIIYFNLKDILTKIKVACRILAKLNQIQKCRTQCKHGFAFIEPEIPGKEMN